MAVWRINNSGGNGSLIDKVRQSRGQGEPVPVYDIPNIDEAVTAIRDSLKDSIAVFGDYDCDGICGALILKKVLRDAGADVTVRLPTRDEGYGINPEHIKEFHDKGIKTVITVDTGVTATEAAEVAKSFGMKFIVTDHHEPKDVLPDCIVVDPKLRKEGFREYSGAGVAYILGEKLLKSIGVQMDPDLISLASLATVVDMVPLTGPNFDMAREGLLRMRESRSVGIQALMDISGIQKLNGNAFGWQLGPRINAAGRMGDPMLALRLLESEDTGEAAILASSLDKINRERQGLIAKAVEECMSEYDDSMFPVFTCDYPSGIVGIVAGRISGDIRRPTIVGRTKDGVVRASGRSIGEFSILDALDEAKVRYRAIEKYGGHTAACGLEIETERLPKLKEVLNKIAKEKLTVEDTTQWVNIDGIITKVPNINEIAELDQLEPHGQGNLEPTFLLSGSIDMVRRGDNWQLASTGGIKYFSDPNIDLVEGQDIHLALSPYINEYNGTTEVMGRVKDIKGTLLSRGALLKMFNAWRTGSSIPKLEEAVFKELGFSRTGEVEKSNLIHSETFRKYGAL